MTTGNTVSVSPPTLRSPQACRYATSCFFAARRVCWTLKESQTPLSAEEICGYIGKTYGRSHGRIDQRLFERIIEASISKRWLTKHTTTESTYESSQILKAGRNWLNGKIDDFQKQFSAEETRSLVMGNIELKVGHHYSGLELAEILENRRRWNDIISSNTSSSVNNFPEGYEDIVHELSREWKNVEKDARKGNAVFYLSSSTSPDITGQ